MSAQDGALYLAHGLGGRSDLPIPLWLAMYAGAVAVIASFFLLAALWPAPRLRGAEAGRPVRAVERIADAPVTRVLLRGTGILLLAVFLAVALAGPDDGGRQNPSPTWFYVWFWVGMVPASLMFGPVWRLLNPLRPIAALARRALRVRERPLPERLAYWPAVAGLIAFLWLELIYDDASSPRVVAAFVIGYSAVHVAAGAVYGPRWFERGDGFEVYSWLISRAAPLGRRADGRLVVRNPLDSLAATPRSPDPTPVVVTVLGSTAFDGISRTAVWSDLSAGTGTFAYLALGTAGFFGAIGLVLLTYGAAVRLTRPSLWRPHDAYAEFAHSIIPIAIGYTVAHYFSFALFQGQQGILLANDPLARGWDLLGLADVQVNYTVMSTATIGIIQTCAIVLGHIVAVASAHDRAVAILPTRYARFGQYPILAVMVGYTTAGIALLAGV